MSGLGAVTFGTGTAGAKHTGRHIVGTSTPAAARAVQRRADVVDRVLDFGDVGQAVAGRFPEAALENLRRNPNVRYVEADGTMQAFSQTLPWGVDRIDADTAHANGETGGDDGGADVAIVDTGIDSDHPDLQANVGAGTAIVSCSSGSDTCRDAWDDDNGHGTHCAGIVSAVDDSEGVVGVSPAATLHAVKVLDSDGAGSYADVAEGIRYVAEQGWDVANLSLGGSKSNAVADACEYATGEGVLVIAAAGNNGSCTDCVMYPAAEPTVVAVSATEEDDSLAAYSATGPEIELAAPGNYTYSTYAGGGYETFSGTSASCPHVSGAADQLMDDGYANTETRDRLASAAEDIGLPDEEQGAGLVDVEAAVLGDDAPSVSWATPTDGETVSGTVTVQIDAGDAEDGDDSLDVTYSVDGGPSRSTTYDGTSGYYEDSWDTTAVSDGEHALAATATDSAGNTSSRSVPVVTDNTGSAPAVDSLSLAEVETDDADAAFDADWQVSDADGDLATVDLVLTRDADGATADTATVDVAGDAATGTARLVAAGDDGSGSGYTAELAVTDGTGITASGTASATETEQTSSAPTVDWAMYTDTSNPAWTRYDVYWAVADDDGDLSSVTTELLDGSGSTLGSDDGSVSGGTATGMHSVRTRRSASEIRVTVTDEAGNGADDTVPL